MHIFSTETETLGIGGRERARRVWHVIRVRIMRLIHVADRPLTS